jgi:P27 family predicted phage terminase small subunit
MSKSRLPPAPTHLSEEAQTRWESIVAEWDLDRPALLILETVLEAFDRMREAQRTIAAEGIVVRDRFDQPKQHPATVVEYHSRAAMLRGLKQLGIDLKPLNPGPGRPAGR